MKYEEARKLVLAIAERYPQYAVRLRKDGAHYQVVIRVEKT